MNIRKIIFWGGMALVVTAHAENWAQWRGPFFNGSTSEKNLPTTWSKTENLAWSAELPGDGAATPIIWEDSIFISSADKQKNLLLLCFNRKDGALRWQQQVAVGDRKTDQGNNMTSPSPVTDGKRVIVMFGTGDLAAYDFDGKVLWTRSLGKEYGKFSNMWFYGSSPLLYKNKLYVQVLQRNPPSYPHTVDAVPTRESFLLCLDPKTGKNLWKHVRETDAKDESQEAYTTPLPVEANGHSEIVLVGGDYVTAHNPETGEELWRCGGLDDRKDSWWRIICSGVATDGMIFASGPKRDPLIAIRDGGKGLVTETHTAWKLKENTPDVCTPLAYQKKLFVLDGDRQILTCLDPKTGEKKWKGNLGVKEIFRASPTGADGKIYCVSDNATVVVLDAGEEFQVLSTIKMGEKHNHASLAVSQGQLFLRTSKTLYCIGKK